MRVLRGVVYIMKSKGSRTEPLYYRRNCKETKDIYSVLTTNIISAFLIDFRDKFTVVKAC